MKQYKQKKGRSTVSQIGAIHTLLSKHGLKDEKNSIVSAFTATRTTSTKEMYFDEAAALVAHLKGLDPKDESTNKMKNKIISMAHEMGWRIPGTTDIDMTHLNNWCIAKSYLKKKLDDYTYTELPKLVSQFEEVYRSYIKNV